MPGHNDGIYHADFEPHDLRLKGHSPDNCPVKADVEAIKNRAVGAWAVIAVVGLISFACLGWAVPAFLSNSERIKVVETRQDHAAAEAIAERARRDRERQEIMESLRRIEDHVRTP